jgi:hypothetical protein
VEPDEQGVVGGDPFLPEVELRKFSPGQTKAFTYEAGRVIGHGVVRSTNQVHQMSKWSSC